MVIEMAKRQTANGGRLAKRGRADVRNVETNVNAIRVDSYESALSAARIVTPDTFADALKTANANHGVSHASRNVNRFTGTRIEYTQNDTFTRNVTAQLSDVQLLFVWCVCFPMATGRVFDANRATDDATMRAAIVRGASIVNGARASFNRNGHGWAVPATPSVRYGAKSITFAAPPAKR